MSRVLWHGLYMLRKSPFSPLTVAAMTDLDSLCCSRHSHLSRLLHDQRSPHSRRSRLLPPSCDLPGPPVLPQATQMHPPLPPATRHRHWVSPTRTTYRLRDWRHPLHSACICVHSLAPLVVHLTRPYMPMASLTL